MGVIGRLLALVLGGLAVTAAVAAAYAQKAKREIVPIDDPEADEVRLAAIFEPISFHSTASGFRGGTIDSMFGGGMIDLRDATLDPAGATLEVRALFGGGQILVPADWQVVLDVRSVFGGIGDGRPATDRAADAPRLTITGSATFGGFGVTNDMPDAAMRGVEEAVAKKAAKRATRSDEPAIVREPEPAASI